MADIAEMVKRHRLHNTRAVGLDGVEYDNCNDCLTPWPCDFEVMRLLAAEGWAKFGAVSDPWPFSYGEQGEDLVRPDVVALAGWL